VRAEIELAHGCDLPDLPLLAVDRAQFHAEYAEDCDWCRTIAERIIANGGTDPRRWKLVTVKRILQETAAFYDCTAAELTGPRRPGGILRPRAVAMYLCTQLTRHSLPEIGREFGGKHHTTVLAARDRIIAQLPDDEFLRREVRAVTDGCAMERSATKGT